MAIFDLTRMRAKTGIASRLLKPTLGLLDPENTRTMAATVAAGQNWTCCPTIESYTALPFGERQLPERPSLRPAYQGSNPISHLWSLQVLRMVASYLVREVKDPSDDEARANMLLASAYAGVGLENAGVHLPHGMSYPSRAAVKQHQAASYLVEHALATHGFSVILDAPAVFRFTAPAPPGRHCGYHTLPPRRRGAHPRRAHLGRAQRPARLELHQG
jgi:hydroxyacid-oxoacid transhydrogenase